MRNKEQDATNLNTRVAGVLEESQATSSLATIKRLLAYLGPMKVSLALALALNLASALVLVISPKILGDMISLLGQGVSSGLAPGQTFQLDWQALGLRGLVLVILYLANFLFSYLGQSLVVRMSQGLVKDLRDELNHKLMALPMAYLEDSSRGDLMSRLTNDVENIATSFQEVLNSNLSSILSMAGALVMMFYIDWQLAIFSIIFIPLGTSLVKRIVKRARGLFQKTASYTGLINGLVEESLAGHEVIKSFGAEAGFEEGFEELNESLYEANHKSIWISYLPRGLSDLIKNIAILIIAVWGTSKVMGGQILIGDLQAFLSYTNIFIGPIQYILGFFNSILAALASAERVFQVLDAEEELETGQLTFPDQGLAGHIEMKEAFFAYQEDDYVIRDLDLNVQPGQRLAIVGPSGSGKTTLVNLIMRFYDLDSGAIEIDGKDINEYTRASIRNLFGMVLQDSWLFEGTVAENIAFGGPSDGSSQLTASQADIEGAASLAQAHDFILALPQGYETMIREDGANLSQGQRQLITIARAFISQPAMVILDEATSSVDTRTEVAIQRGLDDLLMSRTSLVIAHRLSTIRNADKIAVMAPGGYIKEIGSHEELMDKRGKYYEMYVSQNPDM